VAPCLSFLPAKSVTCILKTWLKTDGFFDGLSPARRMRCVRIRKKIHKWAETPGLSPIDAQPSATDHLLI
jgi:hypothetical protein